MHTECLDTSTVSFSKMDIARKIVIPNELSEILAEETGMHIGDGTMGVYNASYRFAMEGDVIEDKEYYLDWVKNIYFQLYNLKLNIRAFKERYGFQLGSKAIVTFKHTTLNLPYGKKGSIIKIPNAIMKNPLFMRACLRGLFDTDGCIWFEKKNDKEIPWYPRIEFHVTSKMLTEQIARILNTMGFSYSTWSIIPKRKTWGETYMVSIKGEDVLKRLFKEIAPRNPKFIIRFLVWKKLGYCPRKHISELKTLLNMGP